MRIVGKEKIATSNEERWLAGVRASNLAQSLGIPDFRERGVFRGSRALFDQMDDERAMRRQRWLNEHAA